MKKEEVLAKVAKKKALVGEMEKTKIDKANWIAVIVASIVAIGFIIVEGALGHKPACFAIGAICFSWASVFYFCQHFLAKRPIGVLVGAIFEFLGAAIMTTNYILSSVGVI